ncbi:free fatty acid receptor 3-like [Sebastes umbrosus]|uniref:free fatty acid receptor 3-like n=1 Tax=Sebastes umbrosus TaxID=72105 RepID=UPI00189D6ADC|nr:free fatty acid receptor 3-like [Sebastes umbrosus]XP_037651749.1 free fatty acid receptor 3-like [Sebastes umbrosus]XP_037651750.1 free fatty acid receptor 3-like [Sebastes umbrosus]
MLCNRLLLSVYIVTFLMGVPANVLAFCTFCRKVRRKAAPIDVLLLNLTISDLIFLAFLPFKMKEAFDGMAWMLPYALCPFTGFMFYVTIYNSTLLLTAVSVERYLGVAFPLRYSLCRRPRYAVLASVMFWVVTSLNLSIVYIMPYAQWSKGTAAPPPTCYLNFTEDELDILLPVRLELFLVLFCVPFFICCFCYANFILILSRLPNIGRRRRLRAIGLTLSTLVVFAVCFGPYNASHVVGFARRESEEWRNVALLSSTFNACLDPIIFYFSSAAVRSMLNHCFRNIMAKLHILRCGGAPHGPHQRPAKTDKYKEAPLP